MDIIKIHLSKTEKFVLRSIAENGSAIPPTLSLVMFHFALSSLRDKGLVDYRSEYDNVIAARLTIKGRALLESNPKLTNPIDWSKWVVVASTVLTALATTLALLL